MQNQPILGQKVYQIYAAIFNNLINEMICNLKFIKKKENHLKCHFTRILIVI